MIKPHLMAQPETMSFVAPNLSRVIPHLKSIYTISSNLISIHLVWQITSWMKGVIDRTELPVLIYPNISLFLEVSAIYTTEEQVLFTVFH